MFGDDNDVTEWDPTVLSPLDQEQQEREAAQRDRQRRALYEIREKLQRAMIVGDRFNCIEMHEPPVPDTPYVIASHATHAVLAGAQSADVMYATNTATSLLLSRQFEGISRKDILIQESDERLAVMAAIHAVITLQMQRELTTAQRRARALVDAAESREAEMRSIVTTRLGELEAACRRRTEAAAEECFAIICRDGARAFHFATIGHSSAQRNWVEQEEERGRWSLVVECERGISRIFNHELSEGQEIRTREMMHKKVPMSPTALIDADTPASTRFGNDGASTGRRSLRSGRTGGGGAGNQPHGEHVDAEDFHPRPSTVDVGDEYVADADLVPMSPAPQGVPESETSSALGMQDNPNSFKPYWGWMLKSTGILMTWQRRFFVFTTRGKLKCGPSDKGPWTVLLTANNIMRVEVDSYHDANGGVAPPTSQYHQYGFYVDAFDPQQPQRPRRLRFCCFSRKELNAWLTVLRRATDVIFALEESGSIARSPARRRLDMGDEKTRMAIRNLTGGAMYARQQQHNGVFAELPAPPTYRRRTQLEEDLAALEHREQALEAKRRQEREESQGGHVPGSANTVNTPNPPSATFGRPPGPSLYSNETRHLHPLHRTKSPSPQQQLM